MIISPIKQSVLLHPYNMQNQISKGNFVNLSCQKDMAEFSFTGIFETSDVPIRLDQAQMHSGIHCPVCGTPMLSDKDYKIILQKSANASNAQELINIFKSYRKFVPPKSYQIFNDMEKINDTQNLSVPQFRKIMSKYAYMRKRQTTHDIKDYLREYASDFPEELKQKAFNTIDEIRTKHIYQMQKDKIVQFTKDLGLSEQQANQIFSKTLKQLFFANGYFMIFNSSKLDQIPENQYGVFIAERLFKPSTNEIVKISKFPIHENLENNKVLICNACNLNQQKMVFWKSEDYGRIKDSMKSYLTDLYFLMGDGKMDYSSDYLKAFVSAASKLSRQNIVFSPSEYNAIKSVERIRKRHEQFAPIEQTQVDIPCAECGSIMLPHAKRKEIEKELKTCNTPYEYSQVLEKNIKYIGKNSKVLANIFLNIVQENPKISNEEFIKKFLQKEDCYSDRAVENAVKMFLNNRSYVANNYPLKSLEVYDIFAKHLLRYIANGNFDNYDMSALLNACFQNLDLQNYPVKPIFILIRNLKTISYRHLCVNPDNKYEFNDKDQIYTILFHLFKFNVATADHLLPENKGGSGDKYNLIGLCKSCNRTKSQKNIVNWYIENKNLKDNLKKQLTVIDSMAKSGQIEGYDDWAKIITQKLYEQTYGRIDFRDDFK